MAEISERREKEQMAKKKVVRVTEEELVALQAIRATSEAMPVVEVVKTEKTQTKEAEAPDTGVSATGEAHEAHKELAAAFVQAIETTRPPVKKTVSTRVEKTAWTPEDGTPQLKLRRKMYQHGLLIEGKVSNEEITLLNRVRQGVYCDGHVTVRLRKDKGLDIDYPIKTASQRLKLVNSFGIRTFGELLQRLIDEHADPTTYRKQDLEDYG